MTTFEDLRIWQQARQLMKEIYDVCRNLPQHEKFRLRDQIERSSSSVCANIAEGYTAYYYNDKIKGVYTARKEAGETQNHLRSMQTHGYIPKPMADDKCRRYQEVIRGINSYVRYIAGKREAMKKGIR